MHIDGKFNKNALSFLTFSRGKRDCVRQSLAMKELYIVLAMTFMKYEVFGSNGNDQFEIGIQKLILINQINTKRRLYNEYKIMLVFVFWF